MMKRIKACLLVMVSTALFASNGHAELLEGAFTVSPFIGGYVKMWRAGMSSAPGSAMS
jgi:hypothetical protein